MANTNQQTQNPNVSFQIKGQAGWGRLTRATTNKWGQEQYTLSIENPVFADDQGNESIQSMDPSVAAVIQQAQNALVRPATQQYPNPSIMVNMRANRQDGTVQKPRYYDNKTKSEVPVEHELNSGTAIIAVMGGHLSDTSSNGVTLYLNGIIVMDASDPKTWYTQNPLLAGFKTLNDDTQHQNSQVTSQDFANAGAKKQNPFTSVFANSQVSQSGTAAQGGNNGAPQGGFTPQGGNNVAPQGGFAPQGGNNGAPQGGNAPQSGNNGAPQGFTSQGGNAPQGSPFGGNNGGTPQGGNNGAPQSSPFGNAPTKGNPFA